MSAVAKPTPMEGACTLCGAALPARPIEGAGEVRFCCPGCAHVAAIVEAVGEESEAARRALSAAKSRGLISAAEATLRPVAKVELPAEVRAEERLRVAGLACPSCAWLVEEVIHAVEGVAAAHVDFLTDTVAYTYDLRCTSPERIAQAVDAAGYHLEPLSASRGVGSLAWFRLALAATVAMNLMALAFVGYDSFLRGAQTTWWDMALAWLQVAVAIPVITWCALPIYRRAAAALRVGRVVMETLLSLGILAASVLSLVSVLTGAPHLYLETATILVALALGGRMLESHFKERAAHSLTDLLHFAPTKARRAADGRFLPLGELTVGETLRIEPGETVPLDIHLLEPATVREALLTGEPHPVERAPGEMVLAGSVAEGEAFEGQIARPHGECVADAMRARVEEALRRADQGSRLADRIAQGFVPVVILVAIASLAGHLLTGSGFEPALLAAISVLVIACPCAFGVAASLALSLAVLRLAKAGILVKDPAALEALPRVDRAVFDKTGTLTVGDLTLERIGWRGDTQPEMLTAVRALEAHSRHPLGRALVHLLEGAAPAGAPALGIEAVVETPGLGITGLHGGMRLAVGQRALFADVHADAPEDGCTRVFFGEAGGPALGFIDLSDRLRPEVPEVIRELERMGIAASLLSGDAPRATETIAQRAGIAVAEGGLLPEQKAARLAALRIEGHTALYVGDGFNDAEALAAADVGAAMASGADLALQSAPIVITRGDLRGVTDLLRVARRSVGVLRGNLVWAFAYNVALIPVAAFGWLAPVHAAALMAISSISVALHSLRVRSGLTPGHA